MARWNLTALERFIAKVNKNGPIPAHRPELGPCWLWTGRTNKSGGYGAFHVDGKDVLAHRFSHQFFIGPIPEGKELDHLCHTKECTDWKTCPHHRCVNPDHLEPVDHIENVKRGNTGRHTRERTHCPHGHEYTPENTYINTNGGRVCKRCVFFRQRHYNGTVLLGKGVRNKIKTHCPRGHEYNTENTQYRKNGNRCCLICRRYLRRKSVVTMA